MVNTNRTHAATTDIGYSLPLDRKRNFYVSASVLGNYRQNADMSYYYNLYRAYELLQQYALSPNLTLRESISNTFRFASRWSTSFCTIKHPSNNAHYRETKLKADFDWQLPWHLQLASDFSVIFYNGFTYSCINKSHCKWNASLARTFFEDNLSLRLSTIGILSPHNNITSTIDATSRIESYTNVLPRYFMVSLVYNLDWVQKNKHLTVL